MLVTTFSEDLVKVVLAPPDVGRETSKLPYTIDLLVPVLVGGVCVTLHLDSLLGLVGVPLVGYTKLVPANNFVVRNTLPLGATDEVLCAESLVTEDRGVRSHGDEVVGGHGGPFLVEERAVVDVDGGSNTFAETSPVLLER